VIRQLGVARIRDRRCPATRLTGSDGLGLRPKVDTAVAQAATYTENNSTLVLLGGAVDDDRPLLLSADDDVLYTVDGRMYGHSPTLNPCARNSLSATSSSSPYSGDADKPWLGESRESILAKRRARRLAERLAKPAYVNTDACCRGDMAGLAYESALLGRRMERIHCSDSVLAEHLALLMAMRDADSRLTGRVVFRVDSAALVGPLRRSDPNLTETRRQINELLNGHDDWSLVLVERERNRQAHSLARRSLSENV
jgi:hypothetical protein